MKTASIGILAALALTGCSATTHPPDVMAAKDPVDPATGVKKTHHHSVMGGYNHRKPVDPEGWENPEEEVPAPDKGSAS
jgi:hypothetical protein